MGTPNDNYNILPFYDSLDEQNHRKEFIYGNIFPLISEYTKILPFQISREQTGANVSEVMLVKLEDSSSIDITSEMIGAGLNVKQFAEYDLIINPSAMILPTLAMETGLYYLEISDGSNTWFSEVFNVVRNVSNYLKIVYWDSENIAYNGGHIDYTAPFKNYVYLKAEIGKPEYPFEEEAKKRDGHTFVSKQISEKKYIFEFAAPEYLCDALRLVRMHDYIKVYNKGKKYDVENIIFTPKWEKFGDLANVEVEFECNTVVKKIGRAISAATGGDFNNDFNNDFKKQ